jgi:hypothetical protein
MHIEIVIDCDTISEYYTHLTAIQRDIKRISKEAKLDPFRDDLPPQSWYDCNCYGVHTVLISLDKDDL